MDMTVKTIKAINSIAELYRISESLSKVHGYDVADDNVDGLSDVLTRVIEINDTLRQLGHENIDNILPNGERDFIDITTTSTAIACGDIPSVSDPNHDRIFNKVREACCTDWEDFTDFLSEWVQKAAESSIKAFNGALAYDRRPYMAPYFADYEEATEALFFRVVEEPLSEVGDEHDKPHFADKLGIEPSQARHIFANNEEIIVLAEDLSDDARIVREDIDEYDNFKVTVMESKEYYFIDFRTGAGEGIYPKSDWTLNEALEDQAHLDEE